MTGWQWFWTLVGFLLLILVLIFLYFFQPFEDLFTLVLNGVSYSNAIFWVALIIGIIGFCTFHWHAYKSSYRSATQCGINGFDFSSWFNIYRYFAEWRSDPASCSKLVCVFTPERLRVRFKFWQENCRNHCPGDHNGHFLCYFLVVEVDTTGSRLISTEAGWVEWM